MVHRWLAGCVPETGVIRAFCCVCAAQACVTRRDVCNRCMPSPACMRAHATLLLQPTCRQPRGQLVTPVRASPCGSGAESRRTTAAAATAAPPPRPPNAAVPHALQRPAAAQAASRRRRACPCLQIMPNGVFGPRQAARDRGRGRVRASSWKDARKPPRAAQLLAAPSSRSLPCRAAYRHDLLVMLAGVKGRLPSGASGGGGADASSIDRARRHARHAGGCSCSPSRASSRREGCPAGRCRRWPLSLCGAVGPGGGGRRRWTAPTASAPAAVTLSLPHQECC